MRSSRAVAEAHAVAVPAPPLRAGCCPTLPAQAPRAALLQSTNLAVSENDKQDIEWENIGTDNDKFEKN